MGPSLKDLVTVLYRPRETMRRILDSGRRRWAAEIVILASVCTSVGDSDVLELQGKLPDLALVPTLALALFVLITGAALWVLLLYPFSWVATLVGRRMEGQGSAADVRAALAWSLVPLIWSVIFRIPAAVYRHRLIVHGGTTTTAMATFIEQGGCTVAVVLLAVQLIVDAAVVVLASFCVGEALRFSTWKGFGTITISALIPIVVVVAAVLAIKT